MVRRITYADIAETIACAETIEEREAAGLLLALYYRVERVRESQAERMRILMDVFQRTTAVV